MIVSGKSLNMQQLHTMFYFKSVLLRLPAPNTITANSAQPPGSNKKLELLLQGSNKPLKFFSKAIKLGNVCIYAWL